MALTLGLCLVCLGLLLQGQAVDPPTVRVIATGGTISNRAGVRLTAEELLDIVPELERYVRAEAEQFSNVGSASLTLTQWLQLARRINQIFHERPDDLAGIVVTTGTDTLEELAYFLHLTIRDERPVVMVGALRNPDSLGYDGAANLLQGLRVAAEPTSRGKGALVVLNGEINSAREVVKTDVRDLQTFQSPGAGLLGLVDDHRVVYLRASLKRHTVRSEFDIEAVGSLPRVDILLAYQHAPGDLLLAAAEAGARAIVIAGAGAGTPAATQREAMKAVVSRRVFLTIASRTASGRVTPPDEGIAWLGPHASDYTIFAEDLSPLKARILMMLALTRSSKASEIQRMFVEY